MKKTVSGFTLIEFLVAVGIGLILVLGGLASYKGMSKKQTVKQAGITFKSNLRSFQQKAMSGEKPDGCISLQNYRVSWIDDSNYSVQPICEIGSGDPNNFILDEEVVFDRDFGSIEFSTLNNSIDNAPVVIILSSDGYEYQVNIEKTGVITGFML